MRDWGGIIACPALDETGDGVIDPGGGVGLHPETNTGEMFQRAFETGPTAVGHEWPELSFVGPASGVLVAARHKAGREKGVKIWPEPSDDLVGIGVG